MKIKYLCELCETLCELCEKKNMCVNYLNYVNFLCELCENEKPLKSYNKTCWRSCSY